jgi:hypothetical protein
MKKIIVIVIVALILAAFVAPRKCEPMGITYDGVNDEVAYSASGTYSNLAQMTICTWVSITTLDGTARRVISKGNFTSKGWEFDVQNNGTTRINSLQWWYQWSGAGGQAGWHANNSLSTGRHFLCVSYDNTSTTNSPVLYVDGTSVVVTLINAATTSPSSDAAYSLELGGQPSGGFFAGVMYSALIYNRILSATEIVEAYQTKKAVPTMRGLVFAPQLCSNGQLGEGGTLAAGNTIADMVSGALGVPSGSPTFTQDTFLRYP